MSVKNRDSSMALLLGLSKEAVLASWRIVFLLGSFLSVVVWVSLSTGKCGRGSVGMACTWSSVGSVHVIQGSVDLCKTLLLNKEIMVMY